MKGNQRKRSQNQQKAWQLEIFLTCVQKVKVIYERKENDLCQASSDVDSAEHHKNIERDELRR